MIAPQYFSQTSSVLFYNKTTHAAVYFCFYFFFLSFFLSDQRCTNTPYSSDSTHAHIYDRKKLAWFIGILKIGIQLSEFGRLSNFHHCRKSQGIPTTASFAEPFVVDFLRESREHTLLMSILSSIFYRIFDNM